MLCFAVPVVGDCAYGHDNRCLQKQRRTRRWTRAFCAIDCAPYLCAIVVCCHVLGGDCPCPLLAPGCIPQATLYIQRTFRRLDFKRLRWRQTTHCWLSCFCPIPALAERLLPTNMVGMQAARALQAVAASRHAFLRIGRARRNVQALPCLRALLLGMTGERVARCPVVQVCRAWFGGQRHNPCRSGYFHH